MFCKTFITHHYWLDKNQFDAWTPCSAFCDADTQCVGILIIIFTWCGALTRLFQKPEIDKCEQKRVRQKFLFFRTPIRDYLNIGITCFAIKLSRSPIPALSSFHRSVIAYRLGLNLIRSPLVHWHGAPPYTGDVQQAASRKFFCLGTCDGFLAQSQSPRFLKPASLTPLKKDRSSYDVWSFCIWEKLPTSQKQGIANDHSAPKPTGIQAPRKFLLVLLLGERMACLDLEHAFLGQGAMMSPHSSRHFQCAFFNVAVHCTFFFKQPTEYSQKSSIHSHS